MMGGHEPGEEVRQVFWKRKVKQVPVERFPQRRSGGQLLPVAHKMKNPGPGPRQR
jgi:hypothetical protein